MMFEISKIKIEQKRSQSEAMVGLQLNAIVPWKNNHEFQEYIFDTPGVQLDYFQLEKLNKLFKPDKFFINLENDSRYALSGHKTISLLFKENTKQSRQFQQGSEAVVAAIVAVAIHKKENPIDAIKDLIFLEKREWKKDDDFMEYCFKIVGEHNCMPQSTIGHLQDMFKPHEIEVYIDDTPATKDYLLVGIVFEKDKMPKKFSDYLQSPVDEPETSLE